MPGRSDICAVIVTYFPQTQVIDNLRALAPQVARILVVDNGSPPELLQPIVAAALGLGGTVTSMERNAGIAAALNRGLEYARQNGYTWLATFDQDSQSTPGMIGEMTRALDSYPAPQEVAIVTPCHVDRRLGFTVRDRDDQGAGARWRALRTTMTSGNLLRVDAALAAGGFDDGLFIDYVDHEFCLRLGRTGRRVLEASKATLLHSLGSMERRWFIFKRVTITNHAPLRRYYMSRNRLIVWRRYWRVVPLWVLRDIRRFVFETGYVMLYEHDVPAKLRMAARGLRDGLRNVRGAFDPSR